MRVLIAPDKFKGTMTAREAAAAMGLGVRDACAARRIDVDVDECPIADGGEGTIEAIISAGVMFSRRRASHVFGPQGVLGPEMKSVEWISFEIKQVRIIESARIIGLQLVSPPDRHPLRLTSAGLGQLIESATSGQPEEVVVCLGGSATVDGGLGAAWADGRVRPVYRPGYRPLAAECERFQAMPFAVDLEAIEAIEITGRSGSQTRFVALCDVDNPLLGPSGAARVYGPQKGATPDEVEQLERGMENLVRVCRRAGIDIDPDTHGAGAAGGLGYGMMAFFGATLVSGAEFILDIVNFDARARAADVVMTGEGRLDEQTTRGKSVASVTRRASRAGKPTLGVAGVIEPGAARELAAARSLIEFAPSPTHASARPASYARLAAERAMADWLDARGGRGG